MRRSHREQQVQRGEESDRSVSSGKAFVPNAGQVHKTGQLLMSFWTGWLWSALQLHHHRLPLWWRQQWRGGSVRDVSLNWIVN